MKHYNEFYEIGNNRYYTVIADDEMYIATESFIPLGKKNLFEKQKELKTGFKVLKFSSSIAHLFNALNDLKTNKKQRYDSDDLVIYEHIDNKKLKEDIKNSYLQVYNEEIENITKQRDEFIAQGKTELVDKCNDYLKQLENLDLMNGIELESPDHTSCNIIRTMLRDGLEHLFTERVNYFTKNVYLYEQDEFGTLTIYRIITIKNVAKTIDTFIYDKKLVESLLKTLYEEGR